MRAYSKRECLALATSWCDERCPVVVEAEARPAALTTNAMAIPTELRAFAANFILLEYMVILPRRRSR
jgi:hypothetical protein